MLPSLAALTNHVAAQVIAYPQDTALSRTSSLVAFGFGGPIANTHEARFQQLIPATHLPTTPSTITALAFPASVFGPGTVDYARLDITVSLTSAIELSPTFAANLPAPQGLFSGPRIQNWVNQTWNVFPLSQPLAHDGRSALVIDIRKVVNSSSAFLLGTGIAGINILGVPPGLRLAQTTFGPPGSGSADASVAATAAQPIQVRLHVDTPTITLRSDPNSSGVMFPIGGRVELAVYGPADAPYCAIVDTQFSRRIELPGVRGAGIVMPIGEFPLRVLGAGGRDAITFTLPNDPALAGQPFVLQAGVADPNGPPTFTNGTGFIVENTL